LPSCNLNVTEGLIVETDTSMVNAARRIIMELLLASTPNTEPLLAIAAKLGISATRYKTGKSDKCILCGLCVRVCREKMGASALAFATSGENKNSVAEFITLSSQACIGCGSCVNICPIGVIQLKDQGDERTIHLYGEKVNTLKLVRCESCGKPYATEKFLDFVLSRLDRDLSSRMKLRICPDCSREYFTVALTGRFPVFEEFPPIV